MFTRVAIVTPAPVKHQPYVGHLNPHCPLCGRTPMQVANAPTARCERMTLPFDAVAAGPADRSVR